MSAFSALLLRTPICDERGFVTQPWVHYLRTRADAAGSGADLIEQVPVGSNDGELVSLILGIGAASAQLPPAVQPTELQQSLDARIEQLAAEVAAIATQLHDIKQGIQL